jgi:DNA-binding IscR family transcriptional regulator
MSLKSDDWISKTEIRKQFRGKDTTLDNAIHALRTRGIIQSKEGTRGVYRLQNKAFALWITLYTRAIEQLPLETSSGVLR